MCDEYRYYNVPHDDRIYIYSFEKLYSVHYLSLSLSLSLFLTHILTD